jgi:hypothetical protein
MSSYTNIITHFFKKHKDGLSLNKEKIVKEIINHFLSPNDKECYNLYHTYYRKKDNSIPAAHREKRNNGKEVNRQINLIYKKIEEQIRYYQLIESQRKQEQEQQEKAREQTQENERKEREREQQQAQEQQIKRQKIEERKQETIQIMNRVEHMVKQFTQFNQELSELQQQLKNHLQPKLIPKLMSKPTPKLIRNVPFFTNMKPPAM